MVLIFVFGLLPAETRAAEEVDYIWVVSTLTGKSSIRSDLMIAQQDDHYFADHYRYTPQAIQELLREILSPQNSKVTLLELGITPEWLVKNSERALKLARQAPQFSKAKESTSSMSMADFDENKFIKKFTDLGSVFKVIESYYREPLDGFFPEVKVVITLKDGKQVKARSTSRHLRMIPWHIEIGDSSWTTYNARITSVLVGLLPGIFATNRDRLTGDLLPIITHGILTSKP